MGEASVKEIDMALQISKVGCHGLSGVLGRTL
jgi:hypothetical protein